MPKLLNCFLAALICSSTVVSNIYAFTPGFPYDSQKVRGVNLGGWLVLEVPEFPLSSFLIQLMTKNFSLGSHHLFLTIRMTLELLTNIPLGNTKIIIRLWPHWSITGTLGSLNQTLQRLPLLGTFPITTSNMTSMNLTYAGLTTYGFQSDTGHLTSQAANLLFKVNCLTCPRL